MSDVMTTAVSLLVLFSFAVGYLTGRADAAPEESEPERLPRARRLALAVGKPNRRVR